MDNAVFEQIKEFVYSVRWHYESPLKRQTRLRCDLGIDGEEATDFFIEFKNRFDVDLSQLDIREYFNPEVGGLFDVVSWFVNEPEPAAHDITLGDLEKVVELGRWVAPEWVDPNY
jgi:hypothetical protein